MFSFLWSVSKADSVSSHVSPWLSHWAYPVGRFLVLPLYFRKISVKGREHLPQQGPVILAPTHRARWDALVVPYAAGRHVIGRDLHFMVSADEIKGLQGWFIRRFGGFPINPRQPGIGSLRHGIELLKAGSVLVIFPEGKISRTSQLQPLQPGLSRLALHTESNHPGLNINIVPIVIRYRPAVPVWGCEVEVNIGPPLRVKDYCKAPLKPCAEQLEADLQKALQQLQQSSHGTNENQ